MKLLILGAGYTGVRIAEHAIDAGHQVAATSRSDEKLELLESVGAEAVRFDVVNDTRANLVEHFDDATVIYSIPTIFDDPEQQRHTEPVQQVLHAAAANGARRFVYLSSTSVYGDHDSGSVDESSERNPTSPVGIMRRDIEDLVLGFERLHTNVVRIVGIYGPGRTLDKYIARGRYKLVDGGEKRTNRIHVDDLVEIIIAVADRGAPGQAYIASDGHPVRVVDLVDWMVEHLGIERPDEVSLEAYAEERGPNAAARWQNTYEASNRRIVEELDVRLSYPTVLDGYEAIFDLDTPL